MFKWFIVGRDFILITFKREYGGYRLSVMFAVLTSLLAAQDQTKAPKILSGSYAHSEIVVDGVLNEPDWSETAVADSFIQVESDQGKESLFPTNVRILYDSDYLYIGAFLIDSLGREGLAIKSLRRDFNESDGDVFGIVLDLFNDGRHCVSLQINPLGAQRDVQVFDDQYIDEDYDIVWKSGTKILSNGWSLEMAVPWKSLRYPPDTPQFRINFFRLARRANELSAWSPFPRSYSPFRIEYAGILRNVVPPSIGRNIRIIPYGVTKMNGRSIDLRSSHATSGGDIRWVSSPNTTVDLTFNSDFAQADINQQIINLNQFSISLPERRPFFSENAGLFRIGSTDWIQPFYSRRIGLTVEGKSVPLLGGVRFIKLGGMTQAGALYVRTNDKNGNPGTDFFLGRSNINIGMESHAGGLLTARFDHDSVNSKNVVGAVDGFFRMSSSLSWQGMLSGSYESRRFLRKTTNTVGIAANSSFKFRNDDINIYWNSVFIDPNYNAGLGFVAWEDLLANEIGTDLFLRPAWKPSSVRDFEPALYCHVYQNASDLMVKEIQLTVWPLYILFNNGAILSSKAIPTWIRLSENFSPLLNIEVPAGRYQYTRYELRYTTDPSTVLSGNIYLAAGRYYRGTLKTVSPTVSFRPMPQASVSFGWERNWLDKVGATGNNEIAEIINSDARVSLNSSLQGTVFYQYDRSTRISKAQARISWEYKPLSYFYFILGSENRALTILTKFTYVVQI